MNDYINITYSNRSLKIDGLELPEEIIQSLIVRGKRSINHRFNVLNNELQVRCTKCNRWISVFKHDSDKWTDISKGKYWISTKENTNLNYFADKCYSCYQETKRKKFQVKGTNINKANLPKREVQADEYCAWSGKNNGIQQTVALTKENDRYLKLLSVYKNLKKNALINKILNEYRNDNPINLI